MNIKHFPWSWLIALIAGFGMGLFYAWNLSPLQYVDAEPHILRDDFKDHFRSAIAAAYASNADLERARARLTTLGDPDPYQALTAQAQRMVAAGESPDIVHHVAILASALQGQISNVSPVTTISSTKSTNSTDLPPETETMNSILDTETTPPPIGVELTSTSIPVMTATLRPTRTATPTLGAPYQLVGQDTVCDRDLAEGLLQIFVTNTTRKQIPGAEINITWNTGEEHIYTGLKPELGNGYADYLMTLDVVYSVRMADGGTPATMLSAPNCTDSLGKPYSGGIRLSFQQP